MREKVIGMDKTPSEFFESGRQAIEMCKITKYDVIFMDHMIPEMNGIDSMKYIRKIQEIDYKNSIIIALTANAIKGVSDMMIHEGFTYYLSKPIDMKKLEELLLEIVPKENIEYYEKDDFKADTIDNRLKPLVDYGVHIEKGLTNCGGNIDDYIDILKITYEYGKNRKSELLRMFKDNDIKNFTISVHALKSSLANIGADDLSSLAKEHEMAGKNEESDNNTDTDSEISEDEIYDMLTDTKKLLSEVDFDDAKTVIEGILDFKINDEVRDELSKVSTYKDELKIDEACTEINLIMKGCKNE